MTTVDLIVRSCCETEPADPDHHDTICISVDALRGIVECHLADTAAAAPRPSDDALWDQTLKERDNYQEWADKLAAAIAKHLGVEIGEHSNMNNPWAEALDAIEMTPAEILSARLLDAWCVSHGKQIPWAKAIEISAVVCKMSDEEKQRLLFLEEPIPTTDGG